MKQLTTAKVHTRRGSTSLHDVVVEHTDDFDVNRVADNVVRRILADPVFAAQVTEQLQATVTTSGELA